MFYDFAVLHSEDVDDGVAVLAKEARVVAVKKNLQQSVKAPSL
jgi:hypothetical protein